jgi:hypothetical protein
MFSRRNDSGPRGQEERLGGDPRGLLELARDCGFALQQGQELNKAKDTIAVQESETIMDHKTELKRLRRQTYASKLLICTKHEILSDCR